MPEELLKGTDDQREPEYEIVFSTADDGEASLDGSPTKRPIKQPTEAPAAIAIDPAVMKRFKARLYAHKANRTKKSAINLAAPTGRSFNYEEIYGEDKYGEETFPDARVWRVYNDEAQLFDVERVAAWRDALDVLLIFIGLFAAVVSAFLIESSKSLQPDYAQITAVISFQILRSLNNSVLPHPSFSPDLMDRSFGAPTQDNNAVNALWYTSLTISLSTALLAMLVKQWLHQYMTSTSGDARERARMRHFRHIGLDTYRVPMIIDLLPTLLHIALAMFFLGLAIHLKALHNTMFALVTSFSAIPYILYFIAINIPFFDPQCPYKSPLSFYIYPIQRLLFIILHSIMSQMKLVLGRVRRKIPSRVAGMSQTEEHTGHRQPTRVEPTNFSPYKAEKLAVSSKSDQLDVDSIVHLYQESSNTHVRHIALEAFGGLAPSDVNVGAVRAIVDSDLRDAMQRFCDEKVDNIPTPGQECRHERLLRAMFTCQNNSTHSYSLRMQSLYQGETDPRTIFSAWLAPWLREACVEECTFVALFTFVSRHSFPLSVWASLIRLALQHEPDNVVIHGIIRTATLRPPTFRPIDVGAVTLECAMQNAFIRSTAMLYLEGPLSGYLSSLSALLDPNSNEAALAEMRRGAGLLPSSNPLSAPQTSHLLSTILPSLFKTISINITSASLSTEEETALRRILMDFFCSPYVDTVSWETLQCALQMWEAPSPDAIKAISTPIVLQLVLDQFLLRGLYNKEDEPVIRTTVDMLQWILSCCFDVKSPGCLRAIFMSICESDLLSLVIERKERTCLHLLWSPAMCRTIVGATYSYGTGQEYEWEWFDEWLTYLHTPERLTFLCTAVAEPHALFTLCSIKPDEPNWLKCFKSLFSLFRDQTHLDSMVDDRGVKIRKPRHRLAEGLLEMKQVLINHHPTLSLPKFDIPKLDEDDNIVSMPFATAYYERARLLAEERISGSLHRELIQGAFRDLGPEFASASEAPAPLSPSAATQPEPTRSSSGDNGERESLTSGRPQADELSATVPPDESFTVDESSHHTSVDFFEQGPASHDPILKDLTPETARNKSNHVSVNMATSGFVGDLPSIGAGESSPRHLQYVEADLGLARLSAEARAEQGELK